MAGSLQLTGVHSSKIRTTMPVVSETVFAFHAVTKFTNFRNNL